MPRKLQRDDQWERIKGMLPGEYGAWRHHAYAEIDTRRLTPLLAGAKNGELPRL